MWMFMEKEKQKDLRASFIRGFQCVDKILCFPSCYIQEITFIACARHFLESDHLQEKPIPQSIMF